MIERECWWSLWIFLVLSKFILTERVLAIINSAKIGMMSYLPLIQETNLHVPYLKVSIFLCWIEDFRSNDPDWRSWTHTSCSLIYLPLSPTKAEYYTAASCPLDMLFVWKLIMAMGLKVKFLVILPRTGVTNVHARRHLNNKWTLPRLMLERKSIRQQHSKDSKHLDIDWNLNTTLLKLKMT